MMYLNITDKKHYSFKSGLLKVRDIKKYGLIGATLKEAIPWE